MDGRFKIALTIFFQVYIILIDRNEFVFSVIYALLTNKSQVNFFDFYYLINFLISLILENL